MCLVLIRRQIAGICMMSFIGQFVCYLVPHNAYVGFYFVLNVSHSTVYMKSWPIAFVKGEGFPNRMLL